MTDRPNRLPARPALRTRRRQQPGERRVAERAGVDVLSHVLHCVRLTGSMFFLVEASSPWSSQAPAGRAIARAVMPGWQHLISYHVITRGACWGGLAGEEPQRLEEGDILVIPHGAPYHLADDPGVRPPCDAEATLPFFRRMAAGELPSRVVEGGGGRVSTRFICGFLGCDSRPFNPVLAALPQVLYVRRAATSRDGVASLIELAVRELTLRRSGSQEVLLRLSELMFMEVVRSHLESLDDMRSGWLAGLRDPVVARALAMLHGAPAEPWTLGALAARIGASRSSLAERFSRIVGQPPMTYLAAWRMQLATRMLSDADEKVAAVAAAVGYESEAAFSRAFKKHLGEAPANWRMGARPPAA